MPPNLFSKSKILFIALFVVLVALGLGVFYFYFRNESIQPTSSALNQPKPDEIVITKLPDGDQLVENKTQGYGITVPPTWTIQKPTVSYNPIAFYTEDFSNTLGCKFESGSDVNKDGLTAQLLLDKKIEVDPFVTVSVSKRELAKIENYDAVITTLKIVETGDSIEIDIPLSNKNFWIIAYSNEQDFEKCSNLAKKIANNLIFND